MPENRHTKLHKYMKAEKMVYTRDMVLSFLATCENVGSVGSVDLLNHYKKEKQSIEESDSFSVVLRYNQACSMIKRIKESDDILEIDKHLQSISVCRYDVWSLSIDQIKKEKPIQTEKPLFILRKYMEPESPKKVSRQNTIKAKHIIV